jgi:ribosomal protein L7/L12
MTKYPYDKKTGKVELPPELELEIANIVKSGDVVGAMKKVMDLTGAGLKFSKEYVDRFR